MLSNTPLSVVGRAGNGRVALQIILEKLNDIEAAIEFCRELGDQTLWPRLIEQAENKPGTDQVKDRAIRETEMSASRFHPRIVESRWKWYQRAATDRKDSKWSSNSWSAWVSL